MFSHWYIRPVLILTVAVSCAAAAEDANSNSDRPLFRSTTSEVRVTFFATDSNDQPVATVAKSDLAVIDNEQVIRAFRSFDRSNETVLDVVALVDLSESVAPRFQATSSEVLRLVAQEQSTPSDSISVLSFGGTFGRAFAGMPAGTITNTEPEVLCSGDCPAAVSMGKLAVASSRGVTPLFDALLLAASFISNHRRAEARPILILLSDGNDTISLHTQAEALAALGEAGTLVYSVDIGISANRRTSGSRLLRQLSESTGGRYFLASELSSRKGGGVVTVLNAALDDMRASYVVTYDLPNSKTEFHSLRLMPTRNLNLTFHSSRSSYKSDYYASSVR